jgi:hypothetical protein
MSERKVDIFRDIVATQLILNTVGVNLIFDLGQNFFLIATSSIGNRLSFIDFSTRCCDPGAQGGAIQVAAFLVKKTSL